MAGFSRPTAVNRRPLTSLPRSCGSSFGLFETAAAHAVSEAFEGGSNSEGAPKDGPIAGAKDCFTPRLKSGSVKQRLPAPRGHKGGEVLVTSTKLGTSP